MQKDYDVIIVGGGVIGCSIAFQLGKRGRHVLVIEKDRIASKASRAAAGMLGLEMEEILHQETALFQLAQRSREMYPSLQTELKERSGIDIEYVQNGFLKIAQTKEEYSQLEQEIIRHQERGIESEILDASEVKEIEGTLSDTVIGGIYVQKGANVSAKKLTKAFAHAAAKMGVDFWENTEVIDLIRHENKICGVKTSRKDISAEEVIVAAGAWSESLLERQNLSLQTYPVKGECIAVQTKNPVITETIFTKSCYIVPKLDGRLIIGATEVPHTFDEEVSLQSLARLIDQAITLIPSLREAEIVDIWSGIRPQTVTGKPIVERNSFFDHLTIATGHYRNGILLAPITGVLVAKLLEERVKV